MTDLSFWLLFSAVAIQSPVWLLVGLNALAFQVTKELNFSVAYLGGLLFAWLAYRSSYHAVGLALMAGTLLLTVYFWAAVVTGTPL